MKKKQKIRRLFTKRGGVLTREELTKAGVSYYYIRKLLQTGELERIKQGVYRWEEDGNDEWVEVQKMVPQGIFCLFSAAFLHELSTFVPSQYHIAIPWKNKVRTPEYPPVKLYYWQKPQYALGQTSFKRDSYEFYLYDREKTVCDFIKFRKKVGVDLMKEVVKNYLERKDRNLNKVMTYARELGVYSIVQSYVEILV